MKNNLVLAEVELVRKLKPPIDDRPIVEQILAAPEDQQLKLAFYAIGQMSGLCNALSNNSPETAQILQVDGLANFLTKDDNGLNWLEGFSLEEKINSKNRTTYNVRYEGKPIDEPLYETKMTAIDMLSNRLSIRFNNRYKFDYNFLILALKKALKVQDSDRLENITYIKRVVSSLKAKKKYPLSEINALVPDISKKELRTTLKLLGWREHKFPSSRNIYYIKPEND